MIKRAASRSGLRGGAAPPCRGTCRLRLHARTASGSRRRALSRMSPGSPTAVRQAAPWGTAEPAAASPCSPSLLQPHRIHGLRTTRQRPTTKIRRARADFRLDAARHGSRPALALGRAGPRSRASAPPDLVVCADQAPVGRRRHTLAESGSGSDSLSDPAATRARSPASFWLAPQRSLVAPHACLRFLCPVRAGRPPSPLALAAVPPSRLRRPHTRRTRILRSTRLQHLSPRPSRATGLSLVRCADALWTWSPLDPQAGPNPRPRPQLPIMPFSPYPSVRCAVHVCRS